MSQDPNGSGLFLIDPFPKLVYKKKVICNVSKIVEYMTGKSVPPPPPPPFKTVFSFFRSPQADFFLSRFDKFFPTFPIPPVKHMNDQSANLVFSDDISRKNQRISHRMPVRIIFGGHEFTCCTKDVSAFGATVEVSAAEFAILEGMSELPVVIVKTDLVTTEAVCNGLSKTDSKFLVGIKLSDGFTWYGKNK